jgi:heptose-I-phosphate ethanolaminephosphotransferase
MDRVREDDCVIVYFSDHGEEVHDYRNHYGRTQEYVKTANILKYQYQVPFLIWCSDKYKELHSDIIANICAAKDKPFMIDNTCQILFNLAGIKSKLYISSRNLISPSYIPYKKRIVQNTIDYESIIGRP